MDVYSFLHGYGLGLQFGEPGGVNSYPHAQKFNAWLNCGGRQSICALLSIVQEKGERKLVLNKDSRSNPGSVPIDI